MELPKRERIKTWWLVALAITLSVCRNPALVLGGGDLCLPKWLWRYVLSGIFSVRVSESSLKRLLVSYCKLPVHLIHSTVALMVTAQQIKSSSCLFSVQLFYSSGQFLDSQLWLCNFLDIHYKCVCMREKRKENGIFLFWQHCHATPHQKRENTGCL